MFEDRTAVSLEKRREPWKWNLDALERMEHGSKVAGHGFYLWTASLSSSYVFTQMVDGSQPQVSISKSKDSRPTPPVAPQLMHLIVSVEASRRRTGVSGAGQVLQHALVLLQHRLVLHQPLHGW